MKKRSKHTARQELFARRYALSGKASQSAMAAGCTPRGARTCAYRWLKKAEIQGRIQELREEAFWELRRDVSTALHRSILAGMNSGLHYAEARRALAIMERLGVYQYDNAVSKKIAEVEERFGIPFEKILEAIGKAQFTAEMPKAE